jgi:hypothetical protein
MYNLEMGTPQIEVDTAHPQKRQVDNKVFLGKANFFNTSFSFCFVDKEARDGEGLGSSKDEGRWSGVD